MTPADLIFLYFCAAAVSWAGYGLKVWEERDRERQAKQRCIDLSFEMLAQKVRELVRSKLTYTFILEFGKPINPESSPTDCIESGNRKA